jgi:hypothetical protein
MLLRMTKDGGTRQLWEDKGVRRGVRAIPGLKDVPGAKFRLTRDVDSFLDVIPNNYFIYLTVLL